MIRTRVLGCTSVTTPIRENGVLLLIILTSFVQSHRDVMLSNRAVEGLQE